MYQNELNYKKNIFLSLYLTIASVSAILFFVFFSILLFRIFGVFEEPSLLEKKEEQRFKVQYRQEEAPKKFIENQNENEKKPERSEFLSEKSSIATSPIKSDKNDGPAFENISTDQFDVKSGDKAEASKSEEEKEFLKNKTTTESIFGKAVPKKKENAEEGLNGSSSINMLSSSQRRSGTYISDPQITLSTYDWEYAPYLKILKDRIYKYWSVPAAYHMGLIGGQTKIKFSISRDGKLSYFYTLGHAGDRVLQKSSEDVVHAIFEMPGLPDTFPDKELTLVISLTYPKR